MVSLAPHDDSLSHVAFDSSLIGTCVAAYDVSGVTTCDHTPPDYTARAIISGQVRSWVHTNQFRCSSAAVVEMSRQYMPPEPVCDAFVHLTKASTWACLLKIFFDRKKCDGKEKS